MFCTQQECSPHTNGSNCSIIEDFLDIVIEILDTVQDFVIVQEVWNWGFVESGGRAEWRCGNQRMEGYNLMSDAQSFIWIYVENQQQLK